MFKVGVRYCPSPVPLRYLSSASSRPVSRALFPTTSAIHNLACTCLNTSPAAQHRPIIFETPKGNSIGFWNKINEMGSLAVAAPAKTAGPAFKFIPKGAILQEFLVGGKNIVLGFNNPEEYNDNPCYFGAAIGRVANRISNATLMNLNGTSYPLAKNNGPCSLHGGPVGWDKKDWTLVEKKTEGEGKQKTEVEVYSLRSPHLEEGFPGTVDCTVKYVQYKDAEGKEVLEMEFEAKLVDGVGEEEVRETVINLTNHSYFNISPTNTIAGTLITLPNTVNYLPVDQYGIPVSPPKIVPYPGLTVNTPFELGPEEPDIDDCFILNPLPSTIPLDTRPLPPLSAVQAYHPQTGLHLEVLTTEPAFQLYTGKYVDVAARKDGSPQQVKRGGFCVEPSRYVDALNVEGWRSMAVVKRGQVYGSKIVYKGWKDAESPAPAPAASSSATSPAAKETRTKKDKKGKKKKCIIM